MDCTCNDPVELTDAQAEALGTTVKSCLKRHGEQYCGGLAVTTVGPPEFDKTIQYCRPCFLYQFSVGIQAGIDDETLILSEDGTLTAIQQ